MVKYLAIINTILIPFLLIVASWDYWTGGWVWMVDVFAILTISTSLIYRWQTWRIIQQSKLLFGERYLQYLEAMGYDDGEAK